MNYPGYNSLSGTVRLSDDPEAYRKRLMESTRPLEYVLNPIGHQRCEQVLATAPGMIAKQGVSMSYSRSPVDIESDLLNLSRPKSKDPAKLYSPTCPDIYKSKEGYPCGGGATNNYGLLKTQEKLHHHKESPLMMTYSRSTNPPSTLRGTGINRFNPLCLDPQDPTRWEIQTPAMINSSLLHKDNHIPKIPRPFDQKAAWPTGRGPVNTPYIKTTGVYMNNVTN